MGSIPLFPSTLRMLFMAACLWECLPCVCPPHAGTARAMRFVFLRLMNLGSEMRLLRPVGRLLCTCCHYAHRPCVGPSLCCVYIVLQKIPYGSRLRSSRRLDWREEAKMFVSCKA